MRLVEFSGDDKGMNYDPSDDRLNRRDFDTRKPKLTLFHLNKLRKMREAHRLDMLDREKSWSAMYGTPSEEVEEPAL